MNNEKNKTKKKSSIKVFDEMLEKNEVVDSRYSTEPIDVYTSEEVSCIVEECGIDAQYNIQVIQKCSCGKHLKLIIQRYRPVGGISIHCPLCGTEIKISHEEMFNKRMLFTATIPFLEKFGADAENMKSLLGGGYDD